MSRISFRLGKFDRARKYYLEQGEFEAAGNCSLLLGEIGAAREYYAKAAEQWTRAAELFERIEE